VKKSDLSDYSNGKINTFSTVTYGISDGMKTTECNGSGNSVTKRKKDGTLWYPTQYGVVHFNPDRISKEMLAPPVYIEQVVAAGKTIDLKNNQTLPAGKRDFEFHYTALNFSNPNKLLFKYKLEGYDEEWIEAGHRRIAYYTKIGYGVYQFKVIAFYKNRVFEESGVNLKFAINSFFYETWWFFILIIIAFSLLVYTIIRFKISGIKKRNLELKKEIDERKIVEEALRKSKERFQGLVSNIPGVVYRCKNDEDWTMMFISDSIYKISGYSSSEFLNGTQTLNNIIYHEDLGKGKKVIIDCVNKRKPFSIEYRIVDKQGEIHWVYDSGQAIEHEGTRDKYLDGVIFDITERKKVEVELAKLKNLLGNVVNSMPSILVGVDLNGRITQWNHCAETATGVSSDDAYGKKVEKVFPQLKIE
ncbi:MAG: PAS domain S-box protein, partial [Calditrichia bacterium]|nr:PAS domain S-box protein [Calditrichia bacterium]